MSEPSRTRMDFEKLVELSFTDRRGFLKFLAKGVVVTGAVGLGAQVLPIRDYLEPESLFMGDWKGNFPLLQEDGTLKLTDSQGSRLITREDIDAVATPGAQALLTFIWDDTYWESKSPGAIGRLRQENGKMTYLAISKKCTHEGCSVYYKDDNWFCPCHAAKFDRRNGAVLSGPPPAPLPVFKVSWSPDTGTFSDKVVLTQVDPEETPGGG